MSPAHNRWQSIPDSPYSIGMIIAGFTVLRLLLAAMVPLLPEEAYYWSWSRHLDWSYFDHPPLATYSIALTTAILGSTAFGIKVAAVLWSLGWNLLWARLIFDMYADRRLAFWSLAALNLTVVYEAFGIGPTPDGPLIFGWVGTIWAIWRSSQSGDGRWWLVAGIFLGLSWLGKYSGVLLLPVIFLYLLTSAQQRRTDSAVQRNQLAFTRKGELAGPGLLVAVDSRRASHSRARKRVAESEARADLVGCDPVGGGCFRVNTLPAADG